MINIQINLPAPKESDAADALRAITRALTPADHIRAGLFGGEFGYGYPFENEIFLMHPHCWCEKAGECPWCTGCAIYQERDACKACATLPTIELRRAAPPEDSCDYSAGRGIFARFAPWTLDDSRHYYDPPNFWFKPTNLRVSWYKYIGRDMASNREVHSDEWSTVTRECLRSIKEPHA